MKEREVAPLITNFLSVRSMMNEDAIKLARPGDGLEGEEEEMGFGDGYDEGIAAEPFDDEDTKEV